MEGKLIKEDKPVTIKRFILREFFELTQIYG